VLGFTSLTADFEHDGWPDIYVACDSTPSLLYHNNHDGTFTEIGKKAGVAYNEDGSEQAGMGLSAATLLTAAIRTSSKPISATTLPRSISTAATTTLTMSHTAVG